MRGDKNHKPEVRAQKMLCPSCKEHKGERRLMTVEKEIGWGKGTVRKVIVNENSLVLSPESISRRSESGIGKKTNQHNK